MTTPEVVLQAPPATLMAQARPLGMPTATSADLLVPPRRLYGLTILAGAGLLATFIGWAWQATLDEFTIGQGKVIPARKVQLVQNLEGGIVQGIHVREGQEVREGDLLMSIDPTSPGAQLDEAREKTGALTAMMARLDAELNGHEPVFPAELSERRPDLIANERALFRSRRAERESALSGLDLQIRQREQELVETTARAGNLAGGLDIAKRELGLLRPLLASGAASRIEVIRAEGKVNDTEGLLQAAQLALPRIEAAIAEARGRRQEKAEAFRAEALGKLSQAESELAALTKAMRGNEDKVRRTEMRSPVNGVVKTVHVTTIGQVVQPGLSVVEIVPIDETLLVEAQVRPQDIAQLRPGLDAIVKLTAYDFAVYGSLDARLEHIGADSVTTEKGDTYYIIRARTTRASLTHAGRDWPIMPGMVAEVEVKTGRKTVMQYLMKPITRVSHAALRER